MSLQQIYVLNILNMLHNLRFSSSKCRLFHNSNFFGLTPGLLQTTHLINGDQWKGLAVTETYVFDGIYMSAPPHRRSINSAGQMNSLEQMTLRCIADNKTSGPSGQILGPVR